MTQDSKPRLRYFANSPNQQHIGEDDKYLYAAMEPRHKLGIIGTGTIGQEHMRVATLLGRAKVHGIYDRSGASLDAAAEGFAQYADGDLERYASLEAACEDPATDALMICTPNYTHIEVVETAVRSGKAIFLEKPMATTLADARRIVELAGQHDSFIQVGLQYRYKAPYVEARHEALERRSLGELRTLSMSEYRPPFLDKVGQWNKYARYSGGTLIEKCCHYFDLLNLFAGARPARVLASGGQAVNFKDFEKDGQRADIDDHAFVIVDYDSGLRASFTLNMFAPHFYEELVVSGERGRLVASETFDFNNDDVARSQLDVELGERGANRSTTLGYARDIEQSGHHGATYFEHQAFIDQLEGKNADSATPLQGLWSIVVAAAAQQSIESGEAIDIETFIKDQQLDRILNQS
ncbi:MAG: Gfo/Idh/MocA family oxidoreductase [Pseudomonadota bacterium]